MERSITEIFPHSAFECGVCLSIVCEPISISCGHTFCRVCLARSLTRARKACPTCRAICHVVAQTAEENKMIAWTVRKVYPELYAERLAESAAEKATWLAQYPIFYYNNPMFPRELLSLHLFEPRYRIMMQRVLETTRAFAYVPNYTDYTASEGDIALVATLEEVEMMADGRCLLEARLSDRKVIREHFVEDGTMGLHFCTLDDYNDDDVTTDGARAEVAELTERGVVAIDRLFSTPARRSQLFARYGQMPARTNATALSLWFAAISGLSADDKQACLEMKDTVRRLRLAVNNFDEILNQR